MTTKAEAAAARDAALALCTMTVQSDAHAEQLVQVASLALLAALETAGRTQFTADDIGEQLDAMGVVRDLATRRRLTSVIVTRGARTSWRRIGWTSSTRRKCAPTALWQVIAPC